MVIYHKSFAEVIDAASCIRTLTLGALIGARLQRMHEERGVQFVMDSEVAELVGDEEGNLTEVCLTSGRILKADVLVAGIGVLPSTDFIRGSDVNLDSRGYVPVDKVSSRRIFSYVYLIK